MTRTALSYGYEINELIEEMEAGHICPANAKPEIARLREMAAAARWREMEAMRTKGILVR